MKWSCWLNCMWYNIGIGGQDHAWVGPEDVEWRINCVCVFDGGLRWETELVVLGLAVGQDDPDHPLLSLFFSRFVCSTLCFHYCFYPAFSGSLLLFLIFPVYCCLSQFCHPALFIYFFTFFSLYVLFLHLCVASSCRCFLAVFLVWSSHLFRTLLEVRLCNGETDREWEHEREKENEQRMTKRMT